MKLTAYNRDQWTAAQNTAVSFSGLGFGTANGSNQNPAAYPISPQLTSISRISVSEEEVSK